MSNPKPAMIEITEMKRARKARKEKLAFARALSFVIFLSTIIACISFALHVNVNAEKADEYNIIQEEYFIVPGDTLYSIASSALGDYPGTLYEYIYEVAQYNDISNVNEIRAGDIIVIFHYEKK